VEGMAPPGLTSSRLIRLDFRRSSRQCPAPGFYYGCVTRTHLPLTQFAMPHTRLLCISPTARRPSPTTRATALHHSAAACHGHGIVVLPHRHRFVSCWHLVHAYITRLGMPATRFASLSRLQLPDTYYPRHGIRTAAFGFTGVADQYCYDAACIPSAAGISGAFLPGKTTLPPSDLPSGETRFSSLRWTPFVRAC